MRLALPLLLVCGLAHAGADLRTLSPQVLVRGAAAGVEALPLERTEVAAEVAGVIARVTVTQRYRNRGGVPLEARYVFPASTRAAVHGMRMRIGARTIEARIARREDARRAYDEARAAGATASLLEQERPNVFQMDVANILPGDVLEVELEYTELLVPLEGTYELVYPAVVGPRYVTAGGSWPSLSYLDEGTPSPAPLAVAVRLSAGMPVLDVGSPSHRIDRDGDRMKLADPAGAGDRDFVLRWSLGAAVPAAGMLTYAGEGEQFFLLTVQPPARVTPKDIPPREYVFVVDVSGSMLGFPLATAKSLMRDLLAGMRPIDTFDLMFFSSGYETVFPHSVEATPAHVEQALTAIDQAESGGGTELIPALTRALALGSTTGVARTLVVVTDGFIEADDAALRLVHEHLGDANVFAFGIGESVNHHLIEGIARFGMGEPFVVMNANDASRVGERFLAYVRAPVLTDVRVDFGGLAVYDVVPASYPDVFAERPLVVFGKYRGEPAATVVVNGVGGDGSFEQRVAVAAPAPEHRALRALWARRMVVELADLNLASYSRARAETSVELGLRYGLVTRCTSFIALDSDRRASAAPVAVTQPLPLPAGMRQVGEEQHVEHSIQTFSTVLGGRRGRYDPEASTIPPSVDRAVLGLILDRLAQHMEACDARAHVDGGYPVRVSVAEDGTVTELGPGDASAGAACLAQALAPVLRWLRVTAPASMTVYLRLVKPL